MAQLPYSAGPFEFDAQGGEINCIELRVPARAVIRTLRLVQCGGDSVAATFELFQTSRACPPGGSSESGAVSCDKSLYTVFGEKTKAAGEDFLEFDKHYPYTNKDGTPTNQQRKLYLQFTPDGAGVTSWGFAMELELPLPT